MQLNIESLCHCQIITVENPLYSILQNFTDDDTWSYINEELNSNGYGINYNILEDCFVVY